MSLLWLLDGGQKEDSFLFISSFFLLFLWFLFVSFFFHFCLPKQWRMNHPLIFLSQIELAWHLVFFFPYSVPNVTRTCIFIKAHRLFPARAESRRVSFYQYLFMQRQVQMRPSPTVSCILIFWRYDIHNTCTCEGQDQRSVSYLINCAWRLIICVST